MAIGFHRPRVPRLIAWGLVWWALLGLQGAPAFAWARHDLITQVSIAPLKWLNHYDRILITPYRDKDPGPYDPRFKPRYVGPGIAQYTTARDILITYADEPDWDMDTGLQLSRWQGLMGGSQGFRHQYYQFLFGWIHFGVAPERGGHFFDLARAAFGRGDRYWGFRYLARTIHFLQDVNQPFHTRPLRWSWLWEARLSLKRLVPLGKNLHFAYEAYVASHLLQQLQAKPPVYRQPYLLALATARSQPIEGAYRAILTAAQISYRQRSGWTLKANDAFWQERVRTKDPEKEHDPTPAEIFGQEGSPARRLMDEVTIRNLVATAQDTRSLLEHARRTIIR